MRTVEGSELVNLTQPGIIASLSSLAWAWLLLIATLLQLGDLAGSIEFCWRHLRTATDHCPFHMGISRPGTIPARSRYIYIYYWYLLVIPTYFIQIVARQFIHELTSPFFMGISCQFPPNGLKEKKLDTFGKPTRFLPLNYSMH